MSVNFCRHIKDIIKRTEKNQLVFWLCEDDNIHDT